MKPSSNVVTTAAVDSNPSDILSAEGRRAADADRQPVMRLLVIAARDDHRLLVRKHVEIQWPNMPSSNIALGKDPEIEEQFAAVGFDAVIIVACRRAPRR